MDIDRGVEYRTPKHRQITKNRSKLRNPFATFVGGATSSQHLGKLRRGLKDLLNAIATGFRSTPS